MINNDGENKYSAFGLNILSHFRLNELSVAPINLQKEIVINLADLTTLWSKLAIPNKHFVVKENFVLFHIPDVAIFLVQNGNEIFVSPFKDSREDQVRLYILGTCMGALLMQRRTLPLHGSAVAIDGKTYAIVGDSGAGKSTLASAFLNRGYTLLSDDVIPVTLNEINMPIVIPAYPQQKLWVESLDQFGINSENLRPIMDRETKYAVPVTDKFAAEPMQLAGIFELTKTDADEIGIQPIQNLDRLRTLFNHTYRNFLLSRLGLLEWHFGFSAMIVNKLEFHQLQRPTSRFTANELVDIILSKIKKGEKVT
ncbi:aldolase [Virgibacillus flavescens]|uniref:aldolase n=1 Tax=Virgibacillus flavescens TaxID=1611422 RepID=UPI003D346E28